MNSDKAITANFSPIVIPEYSLLTLLISPPEGGSVSFNGTTCVSGCAEIYESGTNLMPEAMPEEGYQFSGWKLEQDGVILEYDTNPISISMSSDRVVEASFEPITSPSQYLLSLSLSPDETWGSISVNGATCPESCNFLYESGSVVTLTATPAEGYQFSNWEGDMSGSSNPLALFMDADKAVKAVFIPEPDSAPPSVESTIPQDDESDVSLNTSVTAFFSEPMNALSLTKDAFSVSDSLGNKVSGSLAYDEEKMAAILTPDALSGNRSYTANISSLLTDEAGNFLKEEYQWSFSTTAEPDIMPPEIRSTQPVNGALTSPDISTIRAIFSEPVNPSTLSSGTFFVSDDLGNRVDGTVSYDDANASAIFAPAAQLAYSTTYTVTMTTDIEDLAGNSLQADYQWSFDTISQSDTTAPTVESVFPADGAIADGAINVPTETTISVIFSEPVNPSGISAETFLVFTDADNSVGGSVTYDDAEMKAIFTPTSLDYDTAYTVVITNQVRDLAGNTLEEDFQWGFTTASEPTPPYVMFTDPADTAILVDRDVSVKAVFSEPMNAATLNKDTFVLSDGEKDIPGSISHSGDTAVFTPDAKLTDNTTYTAVIRASAEDVAGNSMEADYRWSFGTVLGDITSPTVIDILLLCNAADVSPDITVKAIFSEAMNPASLTRNTFYLTDGSERIPGIIDCSGTEATFTPDADLAYETSYQVVITTGAEDAAGNPMDTEVIWPFTTMPFNHPPANPYAIRPDHEEWFDETTVLLRASAFSDPENDPHIESHWLVRRADRMYNYHDYDATFNYVETSGDFTEHVVSGLISGMKYIWKVGYKDAGSQTFSWSPEYAFKAGVSEINDDLRIPPGTKWEDFRMVSFFQYPDNPVSPEVLADDMGGSYDRENFRIGTYDPRIGDYVECGEDMQIEPGKAYWFLARNGLDVTVSGVLVTLSHDVDVKLYHNPMNDKTADEDKKETWNMIASPNNAAYDWHDVQIIVYDKEDGNIIFGPVSIANLSDENDFIDRKLWRWDDGKYYSDTRLMEPMSGYWVKVKQENVFLRFPKDAHASGIARVSSVLRSLSPARWSLTRSAIADDGDSPPRPMGDFSSKDSGSGGCFISTICQD